MDNEFETHFPHTAHRLAHHTITSSKTLNDKLLRAAERRAQKLAAKTPPRRRSRPLEQSLSPSTAAVVSEKLKHASERRDVCMRERMAKLAEKAQRRDEKVRKARELRMNLVVKFRTEAPPLMDVILTKSGLSMKTPPEKVEEILRHDPYNLCPDCGVVPTVATCPTTRTLHKKLLLNAAATLLSHIAAVAPLTSGTTVTEDTKIATPNNNTPSTVPTTTAKKSSRNRPAVVPQHLLIAFHINSTPCEGQDDNTVQTLASHLLHSLYAVQAVLSCAETTDKELLRVMKDFSVQYRFYHRGITSLLHSDVAQVRKDLTDHLSSTYLDMRRAHNLAQRRQIFTTSEVVLGRRHELNASITAQLETMKTRIFEIGGPAAIAALEAQETLMLCTPSTPELSAGAHTTDSDRGMSPARPLHPAMSDGDVSPPGKKPSTQNLVVPAERNATSVAGPCLPPEWYVDERGLSRSPARRTGTDTSEDEAAYIENARRLEFKARKAHDARVRCSWKPRDPSEAVVEDIGKQFSEALLQRAADMVPSNPDHTKLILGALIEELVDCYPQRHKDHARSQLKESLDFNVLQWSCPRRAMTTVVSVCVHHINALGTPHRAEEVEAKCKSICETLVNESLPFRDQVKGALEFLFDSVKTLRKDIASYSLMMIQAELQRNAVGIERQHFRLMLRHPTAQMASWISRIAEKLCPSDRNMPSRVKTAVIDELVDFLASAETTQETRWNDLPTDLVVFDTKNIFGYSYAVQLVALRLVISGIVSLVLSKYKAQPTTAELQGLDQDVKSLLTDEAEPWGPARFDSLVSLVVGFVNYTLQQRNGGGNVMISEGDDKLLRSVAQRMTDTKSHEYRLYEQRILSVLKFLPQNEEAMKGKIQESRCVVVEQDLRALHSEVRSFVEYHWEVFGDVFYNVHVPKVRDE